MEVLYRDGKAMTGVPPKTALQTPWSDWEHIRIFQAFRVQSTCAADWKERDERLLAHFVG